jgi:hypothetical protein
VLIRCPREAAQPISGFEMLELLRLHGAIQSPDDQKESLPVYS